MSIETKIARKLLLAAKKRDWLVSVWDGEAWAIRNSDTPQAIMKELAVTDMDTLVLRTRDGKPIGSILLVWGNGEDLITDYTAKREVEALVDEAMAQVLAKAA